MNIWGYEKKLKTQKTSRVALRKEIDNLEDRLFLARNNKQKNLRINKEDEETIPIEDAEDILAKMEKRLTHLSHRIHYNEKMILKEREKKERNKKNVK